SGLLQSFAKGIGAMQQKESICGRCGMTASEFAKTGRLGCPNCYSAFAPILDKNLRTLQGAVENKAKRPMNAVYFEPLKYDPSAAQGGQDKDGSDTENITGNVIGTAGTIDDILGRSGPEEADTAAKRRRKTDSGKVSGRAGETGESEETRKNSNNTETGKTGKNSKTGKNEETEKTRKNGKNSKTANSTGAGKTGAEASGRKRKAGTTAAVGDVDTVGTANTSGTSGTAGRKVQDTPEIAALRRKMEKAVKAEDYEEAARLRDRIHDLERK
ncbi:MAG: UvrB/UvrC motif-containing protein, partial [Lachnospiraceae bacterium]|nr:UvrB/UvrC motif-containing protein [Lachnospiraceae bacterium]